MQMTRLAAQGKISEYFGPKAVNLDKFMLAMEFYEGAKKSALNLDEDSKSHFGAYLDGVNDYISNVGLFSGSSARLLPPEFHLFGMSGEKLEPFELADLIAQARLISFHLSWNWNMDIAREAIRESHPDLADIVEELVPFTTEYLSTLVTSVDDEDLKQWGQFSEETLQERYHKAKDTLQRANAPIDPEIL